METVNSYKLGKKLGFSTTKDFSRKCRIYCSNANLDIETYRESGSISPVVYNLPLKLAIGIIENVRMTNPHRASVLAELYVLLGTPVITQLEVRKELAFCNELSDVLYELGLTLTTQKKVGMFQVDMYIPEKNIVIEYDEYHHKYYKDRDTKRQQYIEETLGCHTVRIKEEDTLGTSLGKVVKALTGNS